jgi:hypothetical protein
MCSGDVVDDAKGTEAGTVGLKKGWCVGVWEVEVGDRYWEREKA